MSMQFSLELKTGFFQTDACIVHIDNKASRLLIEFEKGRDAYVIEFKNLKRIIYNPYAHHELELQTSCDTYVGYVNKQELARGVIDFLKVEFESIFKEIK